MLDSEVEQLSPIRKRRFLKRAARSFGRSALLLSGGLGLLAAAGMVGAFLLAATQMMEFDN